MKNPRCQRFGAAAVALLVIAVGAAAGCTSAEHRAEVHTRRAESYVADGRLGNAIIEFRSALSMTPRSPEAHWQLASAYLRVGFSREAEFYFNEAYLIDPSNDESALRLADLLVDMNPRRADALITEVLERSPENARAYVTRAERHLVARNSLSALKDVNRAIQLAPDDPEAYRKRARIYEAQLAARKRKGREPTAVLLAKTRSNYEKLLELAPNDQHEALLGLAVAYSRQRAPDQMTAATFEKALDAALDLGINSFTRKVAMATVQAADQIRDAALHERALETLVEIDSWNVNAWAALADLRERRGDSAVRLFDELREKRPRDARVHIVYARYLAGTQGLDAALSHLETQLEAKIDPPQILAAIAELQMSAGQYEALDETIARMEDQFGGQWRTKLLIAQRLALRRDLDGAAKSLRELAKLHPEKTVLETLAQVELGLRNFNSALRAVQRALSGSQESNFEGKRLLGQIQHDAGDCSAAVQTLAYLAEYNALAVDDEIRLARCRYQSGNEVAGREIFEDIVARPDAPVIALVEYAHHAGSEPEQREAVRSALLAAEARYPKDNAIAARLTAIDIDVGRYKRAISRMTDGLERDPMSIEMRLLRARARAKISAYSLAIKDAQLALMKDENLSSGAAQLLVGLTIAGGRVEETVYNIGQLIEEGTAQKGAYLVRGQLQMLLRDNEGARDSFTSVLKIDPTLSVVKNDLAYLLAREGRDLDRALKLAKEAAVEYRDNPNLIDTLGYVYLQMDRPAAALRQFRTAASLDDAPSAELQYHLGLTFERLGQKDLALRAYVQALKIDPRFIDARDARIRIQSLHSAATS